MLKKVYWQSIGGLIDEQLLIRWFLNQISMNVEEVITTATRMLSAQTPLAPISAIAP